MITKYGTEIPDEMLNNYFSSLINQIYKILPIKESGEPTLPQYLNSLVRELVGANSLFEKTENDSMFLSIIAVIGYLSENDDCDTKIVKSDVFRAINMCKKLQKKYCTKESSL